ncbi:ATP-binding cassette domain-containing protein, partial [Staphylococcus simulans]|uniref:ATP-binding cassette domain-containing protein n=1 Tax=Staphylococcus simulans TaxID=1286 RepID=UPI000D1E5B03
GKSTMFKIILGILHKDSGSIKFFNELIDNKSYVYKEYIGAVLDTMLLPGELDVQKINNTFRLIFNNWNQSRFNYFVKSFNLPINQKVSEFSKGMTMKLSFAICMAHDPKLLVFDEATSGLDTHTRNFVLKEVKKFSQEENHAVIFSSHITDDIDRIANRYIFIQSGKIIIDDSKANIINNYGLIIQDEESFNISEEIIFSKKVHNKLYAVTCNKHVVPQNTEVKVVTLELLSDLIMTGDRSL